MKAPKFGPALDPCFHEVVKNKGRDLKDVYSVDIKGQLFTSWQKQKYLANTVRAGCPIQILTNHILGNKEQDALW